MLFRSPIARTRVAIAAALGWEPDALAALADGELPALADSSRRGVEFGSDPEGLNQYIQPILKAAYTILGVIDRFPADDLPDPYEFKTGVAAVSSIPGELLFPDSATDAGTWDNPRFSVRQKLDLIAKGHRFGAEMDEREQGRRTGLASGQGSGPVLFSVGGSASRASS